MNVMELDRAEERAAYFADEMGKPVLDIKAKAIYNLGQNKRACYVSDGYRAVQHADLALGAQKACDGLGIRYEPTCKQQGHRMFMDLNFPDSVIKLTQVGEEFACGIRLINSYDKTTGIMMVARLQRLVCSNGMVIKTFGQSSLIVRHNSNLVLDLQAHIEKTLKNMIDAYPNLQHMVSDCIEDSVEWEAAEKIMLNLIGRKKHIDAIRELLPEKKTEITRWDIYNAITDYATHGEQLRPNIEAWLQTKAEKLLNTPLVEIQKIQVEVEA